MAERALPTLDLSGFSSQVANNWKKWKRAFEYYAEGKGLDNTRNENRGSPKIEEKGVRFSS